MHRVAIALALATALSLRTLPKPATPPAADARYRAAVQQFPDAPNAAIEQMLLIPDPDVDRAVQAAVRPAAGWTLDSLRAAMIMHSDAGLFLSKDGDEGFWKHIARAQDLGDAVARDPDSAWFVHQWYAAVTETLRGDARTKPMRDRWRHQDWYRGAAALEKGQAFERDGLRRTFEHIVSDFRSRYVLTYTPRGVDRGGWHPIDVRLAHRSGKVTARRGYER